MIKYHVRSRDLVSVYNEIKAKRLIPDAYFQRNLVWRDIHKQDFIKTILLGYPFPQIFISKGIVDVTAMQTTSCIVDGQQRCNAILEFVDGKLAVEDRYFKDLTNDEKAEFLKYEIAVIELDLDNNDIRVKDIFQRVNRTANSLTAIEKLASEYTPSEFMFFARLVSGDIELTDTEDDYHVDPNIPGYLIDWGKEQDITKISKVILESKVFSEREIIRRVHLQYTLNIMATLLGGYFNRNVATKELLENYSENFPHKDALLLLLNKIANIYQKLKFNSRSMWRSKANFFTLFIELGNTIIDKKKINIESLHAELANFEENTPADYKLAAKEGVNNMQERELRGAYVQRLIERS